MIHVSEPGHVPIYVGDSILATAHGEGQISWNPFYGIELQRNKMPENRGSEIP